MCSLRQVLLIFLTFILFNINQTAISQDFWEQTVGPKDGSDNYEFVYTVAFNSQGTMFAGTAGNGLYRSTDKGTTWEHVISDPLIIWKIGVNSNDVIFACTDQEGIYRSTDGGDNWEKVFIDGTWITTIDFDQNDKIYIGTESEGILSSDDDGDTWVEVWNPGYVFWYLFIDADDNLFVSTFGDGVFRSTDGGANWDNLGFGGDLIWIIAQDPSSKLWIGLDSDGLYSSEDGGDNWDQSGFSGTPISTILIDNKGTIIVSDYDIAISRSTDGGANWEDISSGLSFDPISNTELDNNSLVYIASFGGGVYKSLESSYPATITSVNIDSDQYCQGSAVTITFDVDGLFNEANTFSAELSDKTGSFDNPILISTMPGQEGASFTMSYIPTQAEEGTAYRIRVTADMPANESADNGADIEIYNVLPTLTSPEDLLIDVDLLPELTWEAPANCTNPYTVEVSADIDFTSLVLNLNNHSGTSYTFTNSLSMTTQYWWRVGAETESGDIVYSDVFTFTTEGQSIFTHDISLVAGWNMISTYIIPDDLNYDVIMDGIKSSVVIAKNNAGQVYYPLFEINDIGDWNLLEGYQVYMTEPETLEITGLKTSPELTGIPLSSGWNIISYLRDSQMAISTALASITDDDNLIIAKDNFGNIYYPAFEIDMIEFLNTGQGYQVYMMNNDTLVYPAN